MKSEKRKTLMAHQVDARKFMQLNRHCCILGMRPGTGKTIPTIREAKNVGGQKLVVCRRDDFMTWLDELEIEGVNTDAHCLILDSEASCPQFVTTDVEWVFVTYDLCKNPKIFDLLQSTRFSCVIADEAQQIKRMESARTKAVIKATRYVPRRLALTGSPITNEPRDVFSICLFALQENSPFGTNEWAFLNRYYLREGHQWYLRKGAKQQIADKLKPYLFYVHENDVLDLPPPRRIAKGVAPTPQQFKAYETVVNEWEIALENGEPLELDLAITRAAKLKQIASGFYYDQDKIAHRLPCSKLDLLISMFKNEDYLKNKKKVVIWCSFTDEIDRVCTALNTKCGLRVVPFYGGLTRWIREENRQLFKQVSDVRVFVGQVDMGVGMNELVVADTAVYFSNSHKVASKQQSMARTRRKGSEIHDKITYYELVTEGTVDRKIMRGVGRRMSLAAWILGQLRKGRNLRQLVT